MRRPSSIALAIAALLAPLGHARADDQPTNPWLRGTLTAISENDKWAFDGSDGHYTNGFELMWVSEPVPREGDSIWRWTRGLADALPMFSDSDEIRVAIGAGQNLFTPDDTSTGTPIPEDRPYAGWLYGAFALIGERRGDADPADPRHRFDRLDTLQLQLGIVGPAAGGRKTQNGYHDFINVEQAQGWNNQISNEPGFALYYERRWRDHRALFLDLPDGLGADFMPYVGASLGNVATYAAVGGVARFGRELRVDYGPPRIRPGTSGAGFVRPGDGLGWYFFAGVEGRAVAYDITLDGPLFSSGPNVDRKPLVGDLQVGFALTWRSLRFAYTYVLRSEEFDGQTEPDSFGAFSVTVGF